MHRPDNLKNKMSKLKLILDYPCFLSLHFLVIDGSNQVLYLLYCLCHSIESLPWHLSKMSDITPAPNTKTKTNKQTHTHQQTKTATKKGCNTFWLLLAFRLFSIIFRPTKSKNNFKHVDGASFFLPFRLVPFRFFAGNPSKRWKNDRYHSPPFQSPLH